MAASQSKMPPQQNKRLLDFVNKRLGFSAHNRSFPWKIRQIKATLNKGRPYPFSACRLNPVNPVRQVLQAHQVLVPYPE